eukprot:Sspe_Gene.79133::Locus_49571_Transcript_1_1_Confidence_1.000_Length_1241::g.79133::m.79133
MARTRTAADALEKLEENRGPSLQTKVLGTMSTASAKASAALSNLKGLMKKKETDKKEEASQQGKRRAPPREEATEATARRPQRESMESSGECANDLAVARLVEMGYPVTAASAALAAADGDLEMALQILGEAVLDDDLPGAAVPEPESCQAPPPPPPQPQPQPHEHSSTVENGTKAAPPPTDMLDFLDAPSPSPPPQQSPAAPSSSSLTVEMATPAKTVLKLHGTPPPSPAPATHLSLGIKPTHEAKWKHFVHPTKHTVTPFASHSAGYTTACFAAGTTTFTILNLPNGRYSVAVRSASAMGPGPCTPPTELVIEGGDKTPFGTPTHVDPVPSAKVASDEDFDSFLAGAAAAAAANSSSPTSLSPMSPSPKKVYPTHARGEIDGID